MKHERGTKRQSFRKSSEEANVVQINHKYSFQVWNLLKVLKKLWDLGLKSS